ncbi:MAG: VWA domain-containing protein [Myxococcaceae bacterium]
MLRPLLASLLLLGICACDKAGSESGRSEARPDIAPPKLSPVVLLPPKLNQEVLKRVEVRDPNALPATQVDIFQQGPGRADILWVIDDSGSMKNQRATLGGNFDRFLTELEAVQTNYQIGVISTNAEDEGKLIGQTVKIITNNTPDKRNVFLANTTFPDSRARWEQAFKMMEKALTPPNLQPGGANAGFIRTDAALAVIAVSDEDDSSFGDSSYYARFLKGVKGRGNENLVSFSVIGGTTPNGCYPPGEQIFWGGLAEPAFRYSSLATKTGGVIGSICDQSFENTLIRIAQAINTLRRIFPLSIAADPSTLNVQVNSVTIPRDPVNGWTYKADTQSIAFLGNYVPPPGATIRIEYAIAP